MDSDEISNFWAWFERVAADLVKTETISSQLIEELDSRILALGAFSWELGPGQIDESATALSISPCGDSDLLPTTRAIIAAAPTIGEWEFYPAKQSRDWDLVFEMTDSSGENVVIDAKDWRAVLLQYDDDYREFHIEARSQSGLSEEDRVVAGEIAVDGMIGEERRLELVDEVSVVPAFDGFDDAKPFYEVALQLVTKH